MSRARQLLMAGGTFSAALAIGFVMQNGDALAARFASDAPPAPQPEGVVDPAVMANGNPAPALVTPEIEEEVAAVMPAPLADVIEPQTAPVQLAALDTETAPAVMSDASEPSVELVALETEIEQPMAEMPQAIEAAPVDAMACDMNLSATVEAAAMVRLSLEAPCQVNERGTVHHQGMMFTVVTDSSGAFEVTVPALSEGAVFIVAFQNGEGAMANTMVPELAMYDRAALQWQGDLGFSLHAYEHGAEYGEEGHVWSGAARDVTAAADGMAGFMTRLGVSDTINPLMAEVYTYPTAASPVDGAVFLSVETEITMGNCGRDLNAQSLQVMGEEGVNALDLEMMMPDCDAVGDFLVLNNMLEDLTLAAN